MCYVTISGKTISQRILTNCKMQINTYPRSIIFIISQLISVLYRSIVCEVK